MISSSDLGSGSAWTDEPVVLEVAMRLFATLSASEIVRTLEDEGWEPGELHQELAHRAIAAAGSFADALDARRSKRAQRRRSAS